MLFTKALDKRHNLQHSGYKLPGIKNLLRAQGFFGIFRYTFWNSHATNLRAAKFTLDKFKTTLFRGI